MAVHGQGALIDNFITELQPYLALIDQAVEELVRPTPDASITSQAIESLAIIRDASSVVGFEGLVVLTGTLQDTIEDLLDSVAVEPDRLLLQARSMAAGIHQYMDDLAEGKDTDELVTRLLMPFEATPVDALVHVAAVVPEPQFVVGDVDPELREIFVEEATGLIASFTRGALMLVGSPNRPALLSGLRRDAHTLKGAANMTGFPLIGSIGGSVETLLDAHIDGDVPVERESLGVILSARKLLTGILANLDDRNTFAHQVESLNERAAAISTQIALTAPSTDERFDSDLHTDMVVEPADATLVATDALSPAGLAVTDDLGSADSAMAASEMAAVVVEDAPEPALIERAEPPAPPAEFVIDDLLVGWNARDDITPFEFDEPLPVAPDMSNVESDLPFEFEAFLLEPDAPEVPEAEVSDDASAEDEPELDVYEMAAEIALLARLRPSLQPQNATFFPTDSSALTDDIDALTAEIVDDSAVGLPILEIAVEDGVLVAAPIEVVEPAATRVEALSGMSADDSLLSHALLDLAFDSADQPAINWPDLSETQHAVSDERMQEELRETFAVEAVAYADSLTLAVMTLEADPESVDALRELTRVLHTLKGAAAASGFDAIGTQCHQIEDNLAAGADINRTFTDQILQLASQIEFITTGSTTTADPQPAEPSSRTAGDLRVEMRRLDGLLNLVGELVINRSTLDQRLQRLSASLDELSHMTDRLRRSGQTLERVAGEASLFGPLPTPGDDRIVAIHGHTLHEFDTLEMDRYTDLDVLARELGEVASDIGAVAGEVRNLRGDFETVSTHQRRLTNTIQDELMGIRMVPLATLSPLLHRVVRRVAQESDKDVDLIIDGSEIAFDKALVDALGDALLHLLRNAVDHGIESPTARVAAGKPERGRIVVRAWQDRGNAIVEVIDDGQGVDTTRLTERARAYGFVNSDTVSEAEALQLMFLPGFSTRDSASSVSGRGVGLDAVRAAVERVKGRVTVDTKPGSGTIFQLRLPVMLAVAQAFLVTAGGRRYAVPLADVDFVADRRQAKLSRVGKAAMVEINETIIPAIDLASRLAGDSDRLDDQSGWLLMTRVDGEPRAMRVDSLEGQQEIVVKPLGRYLSGAPGVTGATILGDGQLALIIDVADVTSKHVEAAPAASPIALDLSSDSSGTVLVVDDSLSVRRVLARTLERHGWATIQAHDGVEALERIQAGGIDVVVTDIEMPRMDGFELINSLRRGGWQSLPVVVLTSRSSSKHRDKAIELGANAYIVKPFQEQELLEALERETVTIRVAG